MNKIFFLIASLTLIITSFENMSYAQNKSPINNIVRLGFEGGITFFKPHDLDILIDAYDNYYKNLDLEKRPELYYGWSASGHLGFKIIKYLEPRFEFYFSYTPLRFKPLSGASGDLAKFDINSIAPGFSLNFNSNLLQFGIGCFRYRGTIKWLDVFSNYSAEWHGTNWGYQAHLGLNRQFGHCGGISLSFTYKYIIINKMLDKDNRQMFFIPEDKNFRLNITGLDIQIGFYFSIQKENTEKKPAEEEKK